MLEEQTDEKRGFFRKLWVRVGFLARRFGAWIVTRPVRRWSVRHKAMLRLVAVALLVVAAVASLYAALRPLEVVNVEPVIAGAQGIYVPPSGRAPTGAFDAIKAAAGLGPGVSFYVNNHPDGPGDDSNSGLTWSTAFSTVQHALSVTLAGRDDTVWLAANGSARPYLVSGTNGLVIDKAQVDLRCAAYGNFSCQITNATGGAGSRVATIDANNVTIENITFINTSFVAPGSTGVYVTPNADGSEAVNCLFGAIPIDDNRSALVIDAASFIVRGEASLRSFSTQASLAPGLNIGTGIILSGTGFIGFGETTIAGFEVGISVTNGAALALVDYNVKIFDVITGVYLAPGTFLTQIDASISALQANIQDESGNDTNRSDGSPTRIFNEVLHAGNPPFPGLMLYVDDTTGRDTNTCRSEGTPCKTFQAAFDKCPVGGGVVGEANTLYQEDVTITKNAVTWFSSQGVIVSGTVTVVGDNITINGPLQLQSANNNTLNVQGDNALVQGVNVVQATGAYSVTGANVDLRDIRASGYSEYGVNFCAGANSPRVTGGFFDGDGASVIGFWVSNPDVDNGFFRGIDTINNATNGVSVTLGATGHAFVGVTSGFDGADTGAAWDDPNLLLNSRTGYSRRPDFRRSEQVYPSPLGDGTPAELPIVSTAAARWTYGPSTIVLPVGAIAEEFDLIGVYYEPGTASKRIKTECAVTSRPLSAQRDGGGDWLIGVQELALDGAYAFEVGDRAAIIGTGGTSEWVEVEVVTSTILIRVSALTVNHAGDPRIYLVDKPVEWYASSNNTRSGFEISLPRRAMRPNDGVLCQSLNTTDSLPSDEAVGLRIER